MGGFTASVTRLLALPEGKRAIQPYSFAYTYWNFNSDKGLTGVSSSSQMYSDTGVVGVCANIYGTPWANQGLSLGFSAWNKVLTQIGNSGGKIDYMFADVESGGMFSNWSMDGITGSIGITGTFLRNPNYTQTWNGVTSLSSQMSLEGATITKVFPRTGFDYVVWNKSLIALNNALLNKVLWNSTLALYPNIIGSNYGFFDSGTTFDSPPDLNGHPNYRKSIFGNATSPVLYGVIGQLATAWRIDPTDTTRILLGATTNPLYTVSRSAWNSFLLDMQTLRSAKRNSPNTPLTPWIGSSVYTGVDQAGTGYTSPPPVGYADVVAGYNANVGQTFGFAGNSAYYYEMVRHASLHGVKSFGYFNDNFTGNSGVTQRAGLLNNVLTEINNISGSYILETANYARVDWLSKQFTSGTPKSWGGYTWRTTIKPGTIYEHVTPTIANTNTVLHGSCVGMWITTNTSTPPDIKPVTVEDLLYVNIIGSNEGNYTGTERSRWNGMIASGVASFQGSRTGTNFGAPTGVRAYPYESNPANSAVSSPWHNVVYECAIDPYLWGIRSFYIYMPFGIYPFTFGLTYQKLKDTLTGACSDPVSSPCRWKGFTSSVRALLEGTLTPVGMTAINKPSNVHLYLQSLNGWHTYRNGGIAGTPSGSTYYPGSLAYWDDCFAQTGSISGANNLYYQKLDSYIDDMISIKSPSITAGILSVNFDATSPSATPNTVHLFQTLPAEYTRGNSYELGDWYVAQRFKAAGIPVYCEARPKRIYSIYNSGYTASVPTSGLCGATAISQWSNHISEEYWLWFSDPASGDINFTNFQGNTAPTSVFRGVMSNGPVPPEKDPYKSRIRITNSGAGRTLAWSPDTGIWQYTPHGSLFKLYGLSDVFRKFNNLANTGLTFKGIAFDNFSRGVVLQSLDEFNRGGTFGGKTISASVNNSSLTGYYQLDCELNFLSTRGGVRLFNQAAFVANPSGYTGGYWTPTGLDFWKLNVQQTSLTGFIQMINALGNTAAPQLAVAEGWTGKTYPNDFYSLGTITSELRS